MENLENIQSKAEKLKALAHPHRLYIVKELMESICNVSKMQECLNLPQSTVSQHIAKLKSVGIIEGKHHGSEIYYAVIDEEAKKIVNLLIN
ncbi:MAG TPA: metalloregulator ArsR/SmtB family transcription factor [Pseudobacteroides sp.]|uniref:ArsR/SmtB family transcription factor n=1 Tax=Pseudobacteroides sp. TaxID=1968840 RepID=UPI002F932BBC